MNTSLYQTIKIKKINFIGISSLISWANTFENREFRPKIENFHHHSDILMMFRIRNNNHYLLHQTIKIENNNFFGISSLISSANTLKFENFDQKLKLSTTTQIFS